MSLGEREARSVALEKAYVHQVYQQISSSQYPENNKSRSWPRIKQFLEDLEPGSLVCDVGCGNGKYLSVNPNIYKLGADRCSKLTEVAREKENEVLVCDNLALPFRDECFDAVISVAVVHHFATTERRVGALRELARVLRIGGKLVISVWAMEQRHRKFESQDVLVPWHKPQHLSTPSLELTSTTTNTSEEDCPPPYNAYTQTSDSDSCRSVRAAGTGQRKRGRSKHKGRSIDPSKPLTSSPSSSSLSSPNETCYSFVRRALQKLAGGKRGGSRHRPWFLESWTSCAKDPTPHRYDPEGCEDIHNLPIELRRLEEEQDAPHRRQTFACSHQLSDVPLNHNKSKSLTDIIAVEQKAIVRSRSSVPSLEVSPPEDPTTETSTSFSSGSKPKLVKQKKSVCEEDFEGEERDEPTDMKDLIKALPEFKISAYGGVRRGNVFKQSSMNEELMSTERLREKERVRQNIQKQASLNEDLMFRRNRTLDSLRDTLFSASTAKRFQLLKNGFTNKIKNSTTGIEKVAGASFKNGFVRILQGWAGADVGAPIPQPAPPPPQTSPILLPDSTKLVIDEKKETERRHSREDGSDSSKDSSLQSDTSVDSEDSFASVIFVPKPEPPPEQTSTTTSPTLQSTPASPQPTSPKFKLPPPTSPKLKQAPIPFGMSSHPSSPKLKHLGSSTPSSPKIKFFSQPTSPRPFQTTFTPPPTKTAFKLQISPNDSQMFKPFTKPAQLNSSYPTQNIGHITPTSPTADQACATEASPILSPVAPKSRLRTPSPKNSKVDSDKSLTSPKEDMKPSDFLELWPKLSPGVSPTSPCKDTIKRVTSTDEAEKPSGDKHAERLKQIQELLRQRPSSSSKSSHFPLVRRSTTMTQSQQSVSRTFPRLMSLELFNPETDDMDSDSSGVSSPDSVGSVISVLNEDDHIAQAENTSEQKELKTVETSELEHKIESLPAASSQEKIRVEFEEVQSEPLRMTKSPRVSPSHSLLEAAADVATTLEETVDAVIQSSPRAKRKQLKLFEGTDPLAVLQDDLVTRRSPHRTEDFKHSMGKIFSASPSCTDESEESTKAQDRWSLQVNNSVSFPALDVNKSSSLGAIPKKINRSYRHLAHLENSKLHTPPCSTKSEEKPAVKEESWDEECRQHLADFAEKLSEKLLAEIDRYTEQSSFPHSVIVANIPPDIRDINDPYLNRLSEELQDLTKLSLELHERHNSFVKKIKQTSVPSEELSVSKSPESSFSDNLTQEQKTLSITENVLHEIKKSDNCSFISSSSSEKDFIKCNIDEVEELSSSSINRFQVQPSIVLDSIPSSILLTSTGVDEIEDISKSSKAVNCTTDKVSACSVKENLPKEIEALVRTVDNGESSVTINNDSVQIVDLKSDVRIELSDVESPLGSDSSWVDSRRNTILPLAKTGELLKTSESLRTDEYTCNEDFTSRIEILPGSEMPRRPSISIETSDPMERVRSDNFEGGSLRPGISLESSDAGDISERTGSSSDGSRSGSRRDTIQICDSGSVLSLRPGLSLESSEAGDVSERTGSGSDGSRAGDSRRNTISICGDHTSGSQASLLRPGISLESSDCGDVSERTGSSDCSRADSRRDTSSAGKTASTASLVSDKAGSDCSKDARYADRRLARCDGRSSSEETAPVHRGCMNKLVRQRASTQEPPEKLTKTESCETSLSGSTSQESLLSDSGGGAITFHRYYHVFKEGELDQLIERYVENLHIISSYYDHANWCVIAEKVQVWTI